jgi:hypothetical protein
MAIEVIYATLGFEGIFCPSMTVTSLAQMLCDGQQECSVPSVRKQRKGLLRGAMKCDVRYISVAYNCVPSKTGKGMSP